MDKTQRPRVGMKGTIQVSTKNLTEQIITEVLAASRAGSPTFRALLDQAALHLSAEDWSRLDHQLSLERPGWHTVQVAEALALLEGHNVLTVAGAVQVCRALGATFDTHLILRWPSTQAAGKRFGIFGVPEGAGSGVSALALSYAIAKQFGLGQPGARYSGKDFQSRANREAIAQYLQTPSLDTGPKAETPPPSPEPAQTIWRCDRCNQPTQEGWCEPCQYQNPPF